MHWSASLPSPACDDSLRWAAKQESPLAAWRSCEDGSWLLWIAAHLGVDRRLVVQAACKCARLALPHVPEGENRPLKAIEAAERWVAGLATIKEVRQAATDADAAASTAFYAARAVFAAYAVCAAASAARAAAASAACAAFAAYSADAADRAANAADAADADDYVTVLSQCADIVR